MLENIKKYLLHGLVAMLLSLSLGIFYVVHKYQTKEHDFLVVKNSNEYIIAKASNSGFLSIPFFIMISSSTRLVDLRFKKLMSSSSKNSNINSLKVRFYINFLI